LAIIGYYFGWVRPPKVLAWQSQATFVIMSFLILPLLAYTLYLQVGATGRLLNTGIKPHPDILHAVGISTGTGDKPTWVFQVSSPGSTDLDFYKSPENRQEWNVSSQNDSMVRLEKDDSKMTIVMSPSKKPAIVTYMMTK
jgi:hypothetical protein